jgi:hypothetical protein
MRKGEAMRVFAHVCIVGLAVLLVSCGCGGKSSGRTGMTTDELIAKLESMKSPHEADCEECGGTGKAADDESSRAPCPVCKGTGKVQTTRGPGLEDFYETVGVPTKTENRDLIWEWWYFKCTDGRVRIEAYEVEERGDIARVVTGKVEKIK